MVQATPSLDFLFCEYYPTLIHFCRRRLAGRAHEAEDIVQNAFLRCWRSWKSNQVKPQSPAAYFYRAVRSEIIDHFRSERRRIQRERQASSLRQASAPWERLVGQEALAALPDRMQSLCKMLLRETASGRMANELGLSQGALQVHKSRTLAKLRAALSGRD
jgi:RNA polymerase sigma-70 factor (ECF subfamily)